MFNEEFAEEGIVVESKKGTAVVNLQPAEHCEECSAKIFCKTDNSSSRLITVKDTFGVLPGDKVRVTVSGSAILKSSVILYGIPMVLFVASLILGMDVFSSDAELKSFILAASVTAVYFILVYVFPLLFPSTKQAQPEITYVIYRSNNN